MTERIDTRICIQCVCPFYSSRAGFLEKHHIIEVCQQPYSPDLVPCDFWFVPKLNCRWNWGDMWMRRSQVHKLSQRCLTADWLAPRGSDCSRMHSEVSSDWLPSYIKATRPILEIFKWLDIFRTGLLRRMGKPYQTGRVCCKSLEDLCVKYFWLDKHKKIVRVVYFWDVPAEVSVGFNLNSSLLLSDFHQNLNIKISAKISNINL
jgi:hypothetical protein